MFSKNNKISKRQIFRLLTYDILGIGTLLLPKALAQEAGKNGMMAIALGMGAGILFFFLMGFVINFLRENETYPKLLQRCFGKVFGRVILIFYALYYLCLGGYVTYIFGHLMITDLLKNQSYYWIVAGILGLAVYGIAQGIEGRARVYEILFWFLMLPLFVMLFFAARDVEIPRLFPVCPVDRGEWGSLFSGGYYSFAIFSLGSFALFLVPFAKQKKSIQGAGICAVLFSGGVMLLLYGILQGIFGVEEVAALEYPAVTLMSMIQIPGGFFQRQDALMVTIWFFTVFALLSSSMFYTAENLKEIFNGKKKWMAMLAAALGFFGIAVWCYRSSEFTKWLHQGFLYLGTPLVAAIPLLALLCLCLRRKGKQVISCLALSCGVLLLSGCSTTELENRNFPLAMGVDEKEDSCLITYKFQNLSAIANEKAKGSGGTDFYIEDKDFFTGISKYANETNKILDYNHLKVLILSEDFVEDDQALSDFLQVCGKEELIARNTLLFFAEDAAEILALDKNLDTAIGSYLEELIESREDYKLKDAVTLGDFYNDRANREQLLLVPVLTEQGGLPVIRNYYAISGGIPKGEISINEAVLSYLSQGKLEKLAFTLEDGTAVSVNRISAQGEFSRGNGVLYHNRIRLETVVEKSNVAGRARTSGGNGMAERNEMRGRSEAELKREIKERLLEQLKQTAQNLRAAPEIDITNSFYKLGMYDREKYQEYREHFEEYVENVKYVFEVEVILVNE